MTWWGESGNGTVSSEEAKWHLQSAYAAAAKQLLSDAELYAFVLILEFD